MSPQPISINERYKAATKTLRTMSYNQPQQVLQLDYYEALARSVKYNLDYRLKIVNTALQAGQLDIAVYTMFPSLNASGTLYTRDNDYEVSGITADGIPTGLSSSTPRTLRTARVAMSWNLLDFGMGYVKAKQQGNRLLIAQEESRRQLQQLGQDVLVAYWVAYSAQELINETKELQRILSRSKRMLNTAMRDSLVPKESILNYQAALLEGDRKLIQLQYKYDKAMLDLKHLLFLPSDVKVVLKPLPRALFHRQNIWNINVKKMDAVTLVHHPQLRSQQYQQRIAKFGLETVVLQSLPGLTMNYGWNYDSNTFLLNNKWIDKSVDVAWNLLNLASLPASYRTAKMQLQYEQIKSMALTMAALTETRYAYVHYLTLNKEYQFAHQQTVNARALYQLNKDRRAASIASDQQVIIAKLKAITARMDEQLLMSDLSVALGEMYLSVGVDLVPECILYKPLPEAIYILRNHLRYDFASFINKKYTEIFYSVHGPKRIPGYTIELARNNRLANIQNLQKHLKSDARLQIAKESLDGHEYYALTYGKYYTEQNAAFHARRLPQDLTRFYPRVMRTDNVTWF
jgi:outer membrane protein TolC